MSGLLRVKPRRGKSKQVQKDSVYSGCARKLIESNSLSESEFTSLDNFQRRSENHTWLHHRLGRLYDSVQYYHAVVDIVAGILVRKKINLILFLDIPHLYYDNIAYYIAKTTRIETLILTHSPFPNRFFSLRSIDRFGCMPEQSNREINFTSPLFIDKNSAPEWDYMTGVKQFRGDLGILDWRGVARFFIHLLLTDPIKLLNPRFLTRCIRRMQRIANSLPKWRQPFARHFHIRHFEYFEKLLEFENSEVNWNCQYVYFPLHLQIELTTSTLGGSYSDQLLAIEKLAKIIPDDCFIFIKENPKQTGAMRGAQFFTRLLRIQNLQFVPSYADTHKLIENSQFVATITGTVGWEAICKGKIALFFGTPWYQNLDGAIPYRDGITYSEILNCEIDHRNLQRNAGRLLSRTHEGLLYYAKQDGVSKADRLATNAKSVARTILELIENEVDPTFVEK